MTLWVHDTLNKRQSLALALPGWLRPWTTHLCASAVPRNIPAELLAAVCWRESQGGRVLKPQGPAGTGDNGAGLGLMQLDGNHHPELAKVMLGDRPAWQVPSWNIEQGAIILRAALDDFPDSPVAGVARYNASKSKIQKFMLMGRGADAATTGGNYAHDVLQHAAAWHQVFVHEPSDCGCLVCQYILASEV